MIKRYLRYLPVIMTVIYLSGCRYIRESDYTLSSNSTDDGITVSNDAINNEGVFLLSRAGYEEEGSKGVILISSEPEDEFKVIDCDSAEVVYEGMVRYKKSSGENENMAGLCDLSPVTDEGSYYVMTDSGIVSDEFIISRDIYRKILAERISRFGEDESGDLRINSGNFSKSCLKVTDWLLTREFFQEALDAGSDNDPMVIPRTVLLAKAEIEKYRDLSDKDGRLKDSLSRDTGKYYQYAAVMSLFSYEYERFDRSYASECMKTAVNAYNNAEKEYSEASDKEKKALDDKRFWAAAQLYKLTGSREYRNTAESYADDPPTGFNENSNGYLGTVAYLTCYNKTDLKVSELMLTALMDDINDVLRESFKNDYYVAVDTESDDKAIGTITENARLMVLGNYISKNIRYVEAGENHIAYLYGRNSLGKDYAYSQDSEFYNEPLEFILAGLIDSYIYEDREPRAMER